MQTIADSYKSKGTRHGTLNTASMSIRHDSVFTTHMHDRFPTVLTKKETNQGDERCAMHLSAWWCLLAYLKCWTQQSKSMGEGRCFGEESGRYQSGAQRAWWQCPLLFRPGRGRMFIMTWLNFQLASFVDIKFLTRQVKRFASLRPERDRAKNIYVYISTYSIFRKVHTLSFFFFIHLFRCARATVLTGASTNWHTFWGDEAEESQRLGGDWPTTMGTVWRFFRSWKTQVLSPKVAS